VAAEQAAAVAAVTTEESTAVTAGVAHVSAAHIASVGAVPAAAHSAELRRAQEAAGQRAGAGIGVEVAAIVFGVGRAGLPVSASGASVTGDDLAHSRFGTDGHAFGIGGAHGHGAQLPAGRGPVDVYDRGAVLGVEEAGRTTNEQRLAVDAGAHALRGVATVFECLCDVADIGGGVDLLERLLRDVVGVQCLFVVLGASGVEFDPSGDDIEFGDLFAERGDVLLGGLLHLLQFGGEKLPLTLFLLAMADEENGPEHNEQQQKYFSHDPCLPG